MPVPDGSMLAWPQVPTLDCWLCLLLSMFHYTHSCASKSGMVHTHVGMPSQACVSISNQAQIKSNQVCATTEQSLYMYSSKLTSNPKMRNKAHGSVRRAPPLHPSFGGEEGSQIKLKSTQPSSTSSPAGGGRGVMGVSPRGRWGSPRVGLPME